MFLFNPFFDNFLLTPFLSECIDLAALLLLLLLLLLPLAAVSVAAVAVLCPIIMSAAVAQS